MNNEELEQLTSAIQSLAQNANSLAKDADKVARESKEIADVLNKYVEHFKDILKASKVVENK